MPTESATAKLNRITRNLTKGVERTVARVATEIGDRLVPATPVDTGFARGNWRPSLNAPATTPVTFNDPTGEATTGRIAITARRYKVGDTIFIRNNAPYITRLNEGSSPQAEAGFVQNAIRDGFNAAISALAAEGLDL